ncbi:restriction endonuclease subunit S [Shewanella yunxiaonensis]|uniref:Restriction endonuclease subunit S n=1 Tax=Shewanella yunxiaonensis TaxID=2829809 RepID=A0ABX7YR15_9GAMM|nr:restriction endonuclease subunit S [Shewanella yunxiaonensis]QUN04789.1 restriction endonuclease subunit S [Shewanella yunxiaonensis]
MSVESLITQHIDIWTSAVQTKSTAGRGTSSKLDLYGIKKLRELILELAVRGKLVPQDPNDEPASVLLERIAEEKKQLIKDKKIKKTKKLPDIVTEEQLFQLPLGWQYIRLGECVSIIRGITFPASAKNLEPSDGLIACLRTANVQQEIDWDDLIYVDSSYVKRNDQFLSIGDIVMSMANSRELVGKVSYTYSIPADNGATFGGFLSVIRPYKLNSAFLMLIFRTPHVREQLIGSASQTTNIANISLEKLNPLVISIPPLEEQHRIVAKVDELMKLCDQLEQQTEASITAHQVLFETLLATLTNSADAEELIENWQRISAHFDTLFTTEESIDQLKQTILQLAVMGKLVPQNPADEPASELLKRIAKEKAQLVKDGKIKKQKALPPINDDEKPFELPNGWEWCSLGQLVNIRGGKRLPKGQALTTTPTPFVYIRVSDMKDGTISTADLHYLSKDTQEQIKNYIITSDDIYMTIVGATIGKCGLVPVELSGMNLTENAARLSPFLNLDKSYLYQFLSSKFAQEQFIDKTKQVGVQKMALNRLSSTKVPLPPLNQHKLIVAKLSDLLAFCEQLQQRLIESKKTQLSLTDAIIEQVI